MKELACWFAQRNLERVTIYLDGYIEGIDRWEEDEEEYRFGDERYYVRQRGPTECIWWKEVESVQSVML